MANPLMKILTASALERVRAVVPYPLFIAGLCLPIAAVMAAARRWPAWARGEPLLPAKLGERVDVLIPFALPAVMLAALSLFAAGGWISGYRRFRQSRQFPSTDGAALAAANLRRVAESIGFNVAWSSPAGSFVAVRGLHMEFNSQLHDGRVFPMRLCVAVRRPVVGGSTLSLKLSNRTVVIWDTGERETCRAVGEQLLSLAERPPGQPPPLPFATPIP